MRVFLSIVFILICGVWYLMLKVESPKSDSITSTANKQVLAQILKEPKILDGTITDAGVLYVQVLDDGTRRDGYAEYLCMILKENNSSATRVKIVKAGSHKDLKRDNAYGVLLGESWCK